MSLAWEEEGLATETRRAQSEEDNVLDYCELS